jgi:hypothetical protein
MALSAALLLLAGSVAANPPLLIHYQGYATDSQGNAWPDATPVAMTFRICDTLTGGSCGWQESKSVEPVAGVFSTDLGDSTPIPTSLDPFSAGQAYLEVQIDGEVLSPRQRLVSVPYALQCIDASLLAGHDLEAVATFAESQALADGSLAFGSEQLSYDGGAQSRFEFSDSVALAGPLAVGTTTDASAAYSHIGSPTSTPPTSGLMNGADDLYVTGDVEMRGRLRVTNFIHFGGASDTTQRNYQAISNLATNSPVSGLMNGSSDLYVSGDVEVGGRVRVTNVAHFGGAADTSLRPYNAISNSTSPQPISGLNGTDDFYVSGDTEMGGRLRVTNLVHFGGIADTTTRGYNAISNLATATPASGLMNGSNDLYVSGDLEAREIYVSTGTVSTPTLEIRGGSDISERFEVTSGELLRESVPGTVLCIDPARPGALRVCDAAYDRSVAGVVSGAGNVGTGMVMGHEDSIADGDVLVALTGRVYVLADASHGPIRPGDLLTTAAQPGRATAARDLGRAQGAILGKAMTGLDAGQGLVLVLVGLQ